MTATITDSVTFEEVSDAQDMCAAGDAFAKFTVTIRCGCVIDMCTAHARRVQNAVDAMRRGLEVHAKCTAHNVDPLGPDDFTIHSI